MLIDNKTQEKLRATYNPEGSNIRELQLRLLDILDYVNEICENNGITYWLSSGTCLGAVRHGGFIPWDDDIDIEMTRTDYEKFEKVFKESDLYVLQTYKNDCFYTEPFAKIRNKKTICESEFELLKYRGIFLDIFIMEKSPYIIAESCHLVLGCLRHIGYHFHSDVVSKKIFEILKFFAFGYVFIMKILFTKPEGEKMRYVCGSGGHKYVRIKKNIIPTKDIIFEGKLYPAPHNADAYLAIEYGDYMAIPSEIKTHKLIFKDI